MTNIDRYLVNKSKKLLNTDILNIKDYSPPQPDKGKQAWKRNIYRKKETKDNNEQKTLPPIVDVNR